MQYRPIIPMPTQVGLAGNRNSTGPIGYILSSNSLVLGIGLLLAVAVPELAHLIIAESGHWFDIHGSGAEPSIVMAVCAIVATHFSLQRLGILPLVTARSLILPTFLATFGASILVLSVTKVPVARFHLRPNWFS